jgi:hypothetical protein
MVVRMAHGHVCLAIMMGVVHRYASFVVVIQMSHVLFLLARSIREQRWSYIHPWVEIWVDLVG